MSWSRSRRSPRGLLSVVASAALVAACASHTPPAATPGKAPAAPPTANVPAPVAPGAVSPVPAAPLVGHVTRDAMENYETWKMLRAQDYTPDAGAVKTIGERGRDVSVLAVVATWCPDSKREVPRFFKIVDQAGRGLGKVTLVAVDRTKKDAEGLTEKYQVTRVPTFLFFRGGQEIGRVTERPATTLEGDIAGILK
jgi:thiol-disulfide isomerase/thioredoxin